MAFEGEQTTAPAEAVVFDGCAGWLHPAQGRTAVLLLSPWGFEGLCLRRAWRMLGDELAAAGYPTLRFDYPGQGDSLGEAADVADLDRLKASVRRAAALLRRKTEARRLVLIGQGLGATLAAAMAEELDAAGLALLAPVVRGKEYLRELSVWGITVAETMALEIEKDRPGSVAGFDLPEGLRSALTGYDLIAEAAPAAAVLIAGRSRVSELKLAERYRELGAEVAEIAYTGYEAAITNPTAGRPPREAIEAVVGWIAATVPAEPAPRRRLALQPALLETPEFVETIVRFGPDRHLAGVLCEPKTARRGATVLLLGAGGDAHTGWARGAVEAARLLARDGIASFRMDATDVGDASGPLSGDPVRLYDDRHVDDMILGFDWLIGRGYGPVLPVGRCSGAFAAFNAAARDPRIADLILINQLRYIWERDGDYERASEKVSHYKKQAKNPAKLLARWVRGEIDLEVALAKLGPAAIALAHATLQGKAHARKKQIRETFGGLQKRGVRINLLISRDREAHEVFRQFFGDEGKRLKRYGDLRLRFLEGADHAMTPRFARLALLDLIREAALTSPMPAGSPVATEDAAPEREEFALGPAGGLLPT
jgi:pimeloyl-ACP methyl ester carboxylesterase